MDLWWDDKGYRSVLKYNDYGVGDVVRVFGTTWTARPWWGNDKNQQFETEEDAKAWLATVYRLEHS